MIPFFVKKSSAKARVKSTARKCCHFPHIPSPSLQTKPTHKHQRCILMLGQTKQYAFGVFSSTLGRFMPLWLPVPGLSRQADTGRLGWGPTAGRCEVPGGANRRVGDRPLCIVASHFGWGQNVPWQNLLLVGSRDMWEALRGWGQTPPSQHRGGGVGPTPETRNRRGLRKLFTSGAGQGWRDLCTFGTLSFLCTQYQKLLKELVRLEEIQKNHFPSLHEHRINDQWVQDFFKKNLFAKNQTVIAFFYPPFLLEMWFFFLCRIFSIFLREKMRFGAFFLIRG